MPQIALFAKRNIEAGEELTFDYNASLPSGTASLMRCQSPVKDSSSKLVLHTSTTTNLYEGFDCTDPLESLEIPSAAVSHSQGKSSEVHSASPTISTHQSHKTSSLSGAVTPAVLMPGKKSSLFEEEQLTPVSSVSSENLSPVTPTRRLQLCLCGASCCRGYLH